MHPAHEISERNVGMTLHSTHFGDVGAGKAEGIALKQGIRFIVKPQTFFNQLQWSRNHWMIMLSFLGLALVETQVGRQHQLYSAFASFLQYQWGVSSAVAVWVVMAARLSFMLVGAMAISSIIYLVGSLIGQSNSRRVLFRRLAVVFTVFLAGFIAQHFGDTKPNLAFVSLALYAWGLFLGYIAIREQFSLNHLQTSVILAFAALLVTSTWQLSNRAITVALQNQMHSLAKRSSSNEHTQDQFKFGANL